MNYNAIKGLMTVKGKLRSFCDCSCSLLTLITVTVIAGQTTSSSFYFYFFKLDTTFVGFRNVCSSETNFMFITNPINEDLQHPVQVSTVTIVDSTEPAKVFIHRPDVG